MFLKLAANYNVRPFGMLEVSTSMVEY